MESPPTTVIFLTNLALEAIAHWAVQASLFYFIPGQYNDYSGRDQIFAGRIWRRDGPSIQDFFGPLPGTPLHVAFRVRR